LHSSLRADRFFEEESRKPEQRSFGQRDRDRILYSLAFKRLANVTQVACPHEGYVFHNRLTHTLKVAQLARRIAEKLLSEQRELAEHYGGLDPDVVEAAALAHDLGHPPFGHVAESVLNELASKHMKDGDGFEGNAQSFRIVTVNEASRIQYTGLNLSRATLNAIMKYPWLKKQNDSHKKYGAYTTEKEYMNFAREGYADLNKKCLEASIMDYADSIAYSIHDFDDFYKAGLIPVDRLKTSDTEFNDFINRWKESKSVSQEIIDKNIDLFKELLEFLYSDKHYIGTNTQRADFITRMSKLIQISLFAVKIRAVDNEGDLLEIDEKQVPIMKFLQRLVWV
jgi:dGTPase